MSPPSETSVLPSGSNRDAKVAVSRLIAAGENVEELALAVAAASWLDMVPGEDRQKLRAARVKLRQLLAAAAAKAEAAAANVERSPWAKAEYNAGDFDRLVGWYEKLNWRMIQKPGGASVKPESFYQLYALHMQAANGDNTAERPMWAEKGGLDFEGRARWDAWTGVKGTATDRAQQHFVKLFHEFPASVLYKDNRGAALGEKTT